MPPKANHPPPPSPCANEECKDSKVFSTNQSHLLTAAVAYSRTSPSLSRYLTWQVFQSIYGNDPEERRRVYYKRTELKLAKRFCHYCGNLWNHGNHTKILDTSHNKNVTNSKKASVKRIQCDVCAKVTNIWKMAKVKKPRKHITRRSTGTTTSRFHTSKKGFQVKTLKSRTGEAGVIEHGKVIKVPNHKKPKFKNAIGSNGKRIVQKKKPTKVASTTTSQANKIFPAPIEKLVTTTSNVDLTRKQEEKIQTLVQLSMGNFVSTLF